MTLHLACGRTRIELVVQLFVREVLASIHARRSMAHSRDLLVERESNRFWPSQTFVTPSCGVQGASSLEGKGIWRLSSTYL